MKKIVPQKLKQIESILIKNVSALHKKSSLKILWEVYRLTNERNSFTAKSKIIRNLPTEGIGNQAGDKYFVPPWQIEQAANIIAIHASEYSETGYVDFRDWNRIQEFFSLMYQYNEARYGHFLETKSVFIALAQIGSQQMPWQDGSFGMNAMTRYSYMYSGSACNKICEEQNGISIVDFLSYGFILVAQFYSNPSITIPYDLSLLDGDNKKLKIVLKRFSLPFTDLRSKSNSMRRADKLGEYAKSIFRQFPIIRENQFEYFCVNPSFLILRITAGLISEISGEHGSVRNEVGRRFEEYLQLLLTSSFPKLITLPEEIYGSRKSRNNTPDARLFDYDKHLKIIFECKSTRINYESKFDPKKLENLPDRSDEIIKGITQIWRYAEHCNNSIASDTLSKDVVGVLVTLEPWIQLNEGRYDKIIELAHRKADEDNLGKDCRIKIVLTAIGELEDIMPKCTIDDFHNLLTKAKKPEFNGYMLHNIFFKDHPDAPVLNAFDKEKILSENIWYWSKVRDQS